MGDQRRLPTRDYLTLTPVMPTLSTEAYKEGDGTVSITDAHPPRPHKVASAPAAAARSAIITHRIGSSGKTAKGLPCTNASKQRDKVGNGKFYCHSKIGLGNLLVEV